MTMRQFVTVLLTALAVASCSSKYRVDSLEKPITELAKQAGFYVTLPADGRYEDRIFEQSGANVAQAAATALLRHSQNVEMGTVPGEDLASALAHARQEGLNYVFQPTILHWEDRATEWSGITDKITLKFSVVDTSTEQTVSSTETRASSKWGTLGGDHPQDLVPGCDPAVC
jgi:hypothetical protein